MRKPQPLPEGSEKSLRLRLKSAKTKSEYQRVLCLWLRAKTNLPTEDVAEILGWHVGTVRRIQSDFIRKGQQIFELSERGGRHRQNLTIEEEDHFLFPFLESAQSGGIIIVTELKRVYEELIGRKVPKSTIYRLLERHDWRQIVPRPGHPRSDPEIQEAFKKTLVRSSSKK